MTKTRKPRGRATLKWDRKNKWWQFTANYRDVGAVAPAEVHVETYSFSKKDALVFAAQWLKREGRRWEFTIYNKNGRIAKGGGGKRTYGGGDPERSKG